MIKFAGWAHDLENVRENGGVQRYIHLWRCIVRVVSTPQPGNSLSFRPICHPAGDLMVYTAITATHIVELYQVEHAEGGRTYGTWFLTIRVTGAILRTRSRHHTMTAAREFASAVLAEITGPTHPDLLTAFELVEERSAAGVAADGEVRADTGDPVTGTAIVVIACGAAKLDTTAPAGKLYTSEHFALMLRAARRVAEQQSGRVLILSALHGLVELDTELAPYDVKMGDAGSIASVDLAHQLAAIAPSTITTLLPRAYRAVLDEAARLAGAPDLIDLFAEAPGIGYQRGVAARLLSAA